MTSDWEKSKTLFAAAIALGESERERFLQERCSDNPELLRELTELLASYDESAEFLAEAAIDQFPDLAAPERPLLEAGRLLGQYEIVKPLGQGGMGEVYLAKDTRLNRKVAVKLLPSSASQNIKRFEQEVQTLSSLNHPNILTIHDFGSDADERFMVSEFVDGVTLSDRLKNSPLSTSESLEIALQMLAALSTAHDAGIIHRDIKPENIMIRRDGLVKVLDFGVAKLAGTVEPSEANLPRVLDPIKTNPGSLIGSVGYMSPEQAAGAEIDARSDLFSFGVVLYEMIVGRSPFTGDGIAELIESTRRKPIVPLRAVRSEVSGEMETVVHRCLEKDREKRFQTANEVAEAIRNIRRAGGSNLSAGHTFGRVGSQTERVGNATSETPLSGGPTLSLERPFRSWVVPPALATILFLFVTGFDGLVHSGSSEARILRSSSSTVSSEAYQSYIRGRFFWNKRTGDDLKLAIEEFERALQIEPDYALAYVGLADCYTLLELYTGASAAETLPRAKEYALRAIELDISSSEAHTSLGYVYYTMWQWDDAERHLKRAVELDPNNPTAHHRYYLLLRETGRLEKAAAIIARARELDPLSLVINLSYARSFLLQGDGSRAVSLTQELIQLYPDYAPGHTTMGSALIRQKRYAEALAEMAKAAAIVRNGQTLSSLGFAKALTGDVAGAESVIAEMRRMFDRRQVLGREIALVYVGLSRFEDAFTWLETDFKNHSTELPSIVSIPDLEPIRKDPRFADLVHRMGLPGN
ncbi:MAG: protein kinase [Pyrinomonadaceae bacterium]